MLKEFPVRLDEILSAVAILLAVSTADGRPHARTPLPSPPVWDGMAAAEGCLLLATRDGRVLCLAISGSE